MKKYIAVILTMLLLLSLVGCSENLSNANDENDAPTPTIEPNNNSNMTSPPQPDQQPVENLGENNIQSLYLSCLNTYVLSGQADAKLSQMYQSSQSVEAIPILETDLVQTDLVAYFFFEEKQIIGNTTLSVKEVEDTKGITYVANELNSSEIIIIEPFSDEHCRGRVAACKQNCPDFEILGLVYNNFGYAEIYPIGFYKGETTIKYYLNEPTAFRLVDPFSTIEEGRQALATFYENKARFQEELSFFEWNEKTLYDSGYISSYQNEFVFNETLSENDLIQIKDSLETYDNMIVRPLLNDELEEDIYVLHLLYYHNDLIAELVLKRTENGFVSAWQNVAQKDADGKYVPLTSIRYQEVVNAAKEANPNKEICGVIFENGNYVPFYYEGDQLIRCTDLE